MVRLAGTEVKIGYAGIEIFDQEALNGAMQRGILRSSPCGTSLLAFIRTGLVSIFE